MVATIPANLDFVQAAAVPEAFLTAHDALETQARLLPGERVLIHAIGSGVGTATVQLAHTMGCTVLGTSRTAEKLEQARAVGLDVGIDPLQDDFAEAVNRATSGAGVHAVIDFLGACPGGQHRRAGPSGPARLGGPARRRDGDHRGLSALCGSGSP